MTSTSVLHSRPPVLPRPAKARSRPPVSPLLLLLGWSAQVAIRLAGGPAADLSGSTFYQGGYPLLLTPVFWVTHDPRTCCSGAEQPGVQQVRLIRNGVHIGPSDCSAYTDLVTQ